jgi:hypothetical protein
VPDVLLEREFRGVYQEPNLRYLQIAFIFGLLGFGGSYAMDFANRTTPAVGAVPVIRALIMLTFAIALAATYLRRAFIVQHYTPILNFFSVLGMLGAAWTATRRRDGFGKAKRALAAPGFQSSP